MLVYLIFALRRFLEWPWIAIAGGAGLFIAAAAGAASVSCPSSLVSLGTAGREPCLKGTLGYAPALAALLLVAGAIRKRHPAAKSLAFAAGLFALAMLFRWADRDSCPLSMLLGAPRGTHAFWHGLNALVLYVLLAAAVADHRRPRYLPAA
jgi:hypothetical protein